MNPEFTELNKLQTGKGFGLCAMALKAGEPFESFGQNPTSRSEGSRGGDSLGDRCCNDGSMRGAVASKGK